MTATTFRITTETGSTTSDKDTARVAIHLVTCTKECGTRISDMGLAQCAGLIAISRTLVTGRMVFRSEFLFRFGSTVTD